MALTDEINDLSERVATEINTVRSEVTSGLAGKANSTHSHAISNVTGLQTALDGKAASSHEHDASDITTGTIDPVLLPRVSFGGYATATLTGQTGSQTLNWNSSGETYPRMHRITLTTSSGMNTIVGDIGTPIDGQSQEWMFLASGGTRNVQFGPLIRVSTGLTRGPYEIPEGEVLFAGMKYSAFLESWVLVAATVSES